MDINSLTDNTPTLLRDLRELGLTDANISDIATEIDRQLDAGNGSDYAHLLTGLDAHSFRARIDTDRLAEHALVSPGLALLAVSKIARAVENSGGQSPFSTVRRFASTLFGQA